MALVAIVGRPNVGKSTLFNRLVGMRQAIVDETAGVTRDRHYGKCEWNGREFSVVDTGGYTSNSDDVFEDAIRRQVGIAIEEADVVLFMCEAATGITDYDSEIADLLRRSKKPVVLCVNKVDSGEKMYDAFDFYSLGLGEVWTISAANGSGTGDLLDEILKVLPEDDAQADDHADIPHIAIVGRPNVGKSSLTNRILGQERVIVSEVAGTTRDAVDSYFENGDGRYLFIDTAGLRKKSRVDDRVEKFSAMRSQDAIQRSDVCLLLLDAREGVTEQDTKVAGMIHESGKACILVVNKWDLVEKETKTMDRQREDIRKALVFMPYAPIVFISALTGQRVPRLFELINYVNEQSAMRIATGTLNSLLADAVARVQPPTDKGRRLKLLYMTQTGVKPPTFIIFCNDRELFHFSYQRYIENQLRSTFGLEGTPVRLIIRQRGESADL